MVTGFTVSSDSKTTVLVRAVGPGLNAFGVTGTLAHPKLELFDSDGLKIAEDDDFEADAAATFSSLDAFAFTPGSPGAVIVATLFPGN